MHSIVIPIFNEAANLAELHTRISALINSMPDQWEVILVNDGSSDNSAQLIDSICKLDPRFKALHFSRNFGHQAAVSAGLEWASGDTVTMIDGDLQDPPELIREFFAKWKEGYKLVYAVRRSRQGETAFKLWTASLFYKLLHATSKIKIPMNAGDFRLMDRCVADALRALPERSKFLRGLSIWVGYSSTEVLYDRAPRTKGQSNYSLIEMLRLAAHGLTGFTTAPLRLGWLFGSLTMTAALLAAFSCLVFDVSAVVSTAQVIMGAALGFLMGIQMILMAILGEYISKLHTEATRRPLFIVAKSINFKTNDEPAQQQSRHLTAV